MSGADESDIRPLDERDRKVLAVLDKPENARGRPVRNAVLARFGDYERLGLVRLSGCRIGPLGLPDHDHFWARLTDAGRQWLSAPAPAPASPCP